MPIPALFLSHGAPTLALEDNAVTRTFDFRNMRPGQRTELQNFYKDSAYTLAVRFLGFQKVSVDAGTFDELVASVDDGLLVTSFAGLHSGVNPVSGDFSVGADGIRIRNGALRTMPAMTADSR